MNLQAIITKISADLSHDPDIEISADTELLMSGLVESLSVITLIAWLEDEMKTLIDPGLVTLENFETPAAINALCEQVQASSQ